MNGSIILCDHVYETKDNKFVISGTYNHWRCTGSTLKIPALHCYVRLYPDRTGTLPCRILLRDENIIRNPNPLFSVAIPLTVTAEHIPVMEFAFHSHAPGEINVQFDVPPDPSTEHINDIHIPLSLCLLIDDEIVATSPLKVSFIHAS